MFDDLNDLEDLIAFEEAMENAEELPIDEEPDGFSAMWAEFAF